MPLGSILGPELSSLRSLYCTYVQSCTLYCASSWMASIAANHLRKLESQHLSGARIITGCTRSTPTVPLLKEAGLIPPTVHANLAAAKLRERALHHTQETPIANAAICSVELRIRRHGAGGVARRSLHDSATAISEHLGLEAFPQESFSQGLPLWCSGEGVTFSINLDSLTGSSDDPNPASGLLAATAALARLPPTDAELWTDGSMTPGVGAGAGFVVYVNSQLYVSEAHPAGLESSDFWVETVAMSLGLSALKDSFFLLQHQNLHRLPDPHHNTHQRTGSST